VNLDDLEAISKLDSHDLIAEIAALPERLQKSWNLGQSLDLPAWEGFRQVVIAGMGISALAADVLAAYIFSSCQLPVVVVRNYTLPAWATGPETLVVCASFSGSTEETVSVYNEAAARGCRVFALTSEAGMLAEKQDGLQVLWLFGSPSQAGSAVGMIFGLLLAAFTRLGLIEDPGGDLAGAISAMKAQQKTLGVEIPLMQNEAKRLAGQCVGRWLTIFGSDHLAPVARYWKAQLSLLAKTNAQWEEFPEANHNTMFGVMHPPDQINHTMLLFLRARDCHPRNQQRTEITKEFLMLEGLGTDFFNAKGDQILAQIWTTLHFGDYLAYYLAILYGVDPGWLDAVAGWKAYLETV
jgi:glucose/mannose-6-phosphate isomerase